MEPKKEYAITIGRVSTTKQDVFGDSLDDQEKTIQLAIQRTEIQFNCKIAIDKSFDFTESASVSLVLQPLQKVIEYCKKSPKKIKFAFIKSIDRGTRAGAIIYGLLKTSLSEIGVMLIDTYGIIGTQTVNTLEHLGEKYSWSEYSPTWITELLEAERAKAEVRDIQTRMIGAAIRYIRLGYWRASTPIGFISEKADTPHGKRFVLRPHPVEAKWVIKMFELRAQGKTDQEIVQLVNKMGFITRKRFYRDKEDRSKIINVMGQQRLNIKRLLKYIQTPLYAGVNTEKWTQNQPVKLHEGGLVSIELFNQANRGKITIAEEDGFVKVFKGKPPAWALKKHKLNPLYPYKQYVLCPICKHQLMGSASRGKSGRYFPAYHCQRSHKSFRVPLKDFNETIAKFVKQMKFSPKFIVHFQFRFLKNWKIRMKQINTDTMDWEKFIIDLRGKRKTLSDRIDTLSYAPLIQEAEAKVEEIDKQIEEAQGERNKKEQEEVDVHLLMKTAKYYMEHLEILLLESPDPFKRAILFSLAFEETPTYEDLVNGTPRLSPLFRLNYAFKHHQSMSSGANGIQTRDLLRDKQTL